MKKNRKKSLIFAITLIMAIAIPTIASAAWSGQGAFYLRENQDWTNTTTSNTRLSAAKTTSTRLVDVKTISLTMWNNPWFRIVNSNNEVRSVEFLTGNKGNTRTQDSTAEPGYIYYANLKPAFLQTGDDSIVIQFDPR